MSSGFECVLEIGRLFAGVEWPWMVCGGWAIDLFLARVTRQHKDVDIAMFRQDQLKVQAHLDGWQLYIAHDGKLALWDKGNYLELPVQGIWAWPPGAVAGKVEEPPELELLLNERSEGQWVYRRNPVITRELEKTCLWGGPGGAMPYIAPEIALLYKSKGLRSEDKHDFEAAWPELNKEQQEWLREALRVGNPEHPWLKRD